MNKDKCKGCEWYGKPYWSINNPCDNCPRNNIQVLTRLTDPTIEQLQQELNQKNKIIEKPKKIEKLNGILEFRQNGNHISRLPNNEELMFKINEIIDYINKGSEE